MIRIKHITGAAFAFLVVLPVTYVLTNRNPPADIVSSGIDPSTIRAGECATVFFTAEVRRICSSTSDPRIYTSLNHVWPLAPFQSRGPHATGLQTFAYTVCLPLSIHAAKGTYRHKVAFHCWPFDDWWPIIIDLPPVPFDIKVDSSVEKLGLEKTISPPGVIK